MFRNLMCAVCALVLGAGVAWADDIKGKVKLTDADKGTITLTVGDKDQTLTVGKDVKITQQVGKKEAKAKTEDVPGGLTGLAAGTDVTVTTEKKDGKDVVTTIKVDGLVAKKKKNK